MTLPPIPSAPRQHRILPGAAAGPAFAPPVAPAGRAVYRGKHRIPALPLLAAGALLMGATVLPAAAQEVPAPGITEPAPSAAPVPAGEPSPAPADSPALPSPRPLDRDTALILARDRSLRTALQDSRIREKKAGLDEARSRLWPQLSASASASWMTNPNEGIVIKAGSMGYTPSPGSTYPTGFPESDIVLMEPYENTYFKAGAEISWPFFTWGKIDRAIDIASASLDMERTEGEKTLLTLDHDTRAAWSGALLAKRSRAILQETLDLADTMVADKELSFQQGMVNRAEVLQVRNSREQIHSRLVAVQQAYSSAMAGLEFQCGPLDGRIPEGDWRIPEGVPDLDALYTLAARGPESRNELARIDLAGQAVALREASTLGRPDLALNVKLDITGQRIPLVAANWSDTWDHNLIITLATQVPLFDGGQRQASLEQAREQYNQARMGAALAAEGRRVTLQQKREALQKALAERTWKQTALESAREQEKNARVSFENDLLTREEYQGARLQTHMARLEAEVAAWTADQALNDLEYTAAADLAP